MRPQVQAPLSDSAAASSSGLVVELGQQVLLLATRQIASWDSEGIGAFRVAVNASALQLKSGILVGQVTRALKDSRAQAERLEIEITEHSIVDDQQTSVDALLALRRMGVRIAMDDFGTGVSSLAYLRRLPVDKLKIDRSFVRELPGHAGDAAIVRAIVSMAGALGLKVVAEGVETAAQRRFLQSIGVDFGQGYWFGRPMPAEQRAQMLRLREPLDTTWAGLDGV